MPHATAPAVDGEFVEFLEAALAYSDTQLQRAQQEIWRLRAVVASSRLEIR